MPYLIDGHNLIGQMRDLSLSDPNDEEKLIERLRLAAERSQKRISVVFDPNPHDVTPPIGRNSTQHSRVTAIFAHPGKKADDVIRRMAGEAKDKQGLIVVTSDAAVADFTRRCGVRVQSSRDFIRWLEGQLTGKVDPNLKPVGSSREVLNWGDVFKEPEPAQKTRKPAPDTPKIKRLTRSEQLKLQVKRIRPLK